MECIEDSEIVVISHEAAYDLLSFSPSFDCLARIIMEEELMNYQRIVANLITLNPEKRYLNFLETHQPFVQRIPQYHIATYLGVNAESLSRIKKRIHSKIKILNLCQ